MPRFVHSPKDNPARENDKPFAKWMPLKILVRDE